LPFFTNYVIAKEIIYSTRDEKQFNGKIWVLTNPKVYSSSENFIMFCKNTGFATLVGTSTGGDGGIATQYYYHFQIADLSFVLVCSMD